MMIEMNILDALLDLFRSYGYWIVFFGVMLENAGVPVPGETILLAAGFFASGGHFSLILVMAIATFGAVLGDNCGYWIGHKVGRKVLIKYGKYVMLTETRFQFMEKYFHSHGDKTVLVARFITGFRVFTALFAGATGMLWRKFLIFNMLGAVLWAVVITLLGYFFGKSWDLLERYIKGAGWALIGALATAVIVYHIIKRIRSRRAAKQMLTSEADSASANATSADAASGETN
jgi:membrane protein DedA with SNARE-associated domain